MNNTLTRREWLARSAALAAMHAPLLTAHSAPTDAPPVRLRHLRLQTQPLDAMHVFYSETLGFPIIESDHAHFIMRVGDSTIEFVKTTENTKPFYHFAFSISENKLDAAKTWSEARTTVLTNPRSGDQVMHFRQWNAHAIYFLDPAGNIGEFIAHHSLPTARSGEFSLDDVLYTSEIGLVVDDVREAVDEMLPLVGVEDMGRVGKNFAAVGDAHGYLIVVPENREWLMTDLNAKPHPVYATLESRTTGEAKLTSGPYTLNRVAPQES